MARIVDWDEMDRMVFMIKELLKYYEYITVYPKIIVAGKY